MFLDRQGDKQLGMGLLVNKSLKVTSTNLVNKRIATLTVTKKDNFNFESTPTGVKILNNKKKKKLCELSIFNVHAPPYIGKTSPQGKRSLTDDFYKDFQETIKRFFYLKLTWLESFFGIIVKSFRYHSCFSKLVLRLMSSFTSYLVSE